MTKKTFIRVTIYLLIWIIYLIFMSINSPLGINWLDWHSQRIYNFSEYLNLNGYFNNFGFSIWSKCNDCALETENWTNKIYLSMNIFSYLPYVLINTLFGDIFLKSHGHLFDKTIIFFSGILISELFLKFNNKNVILDKTFIKSLFIFVFFITNPWTYKMILAHWVHIYFVFFFLLGINMFLANRKNLGFIFFFLGGCFDYQSSAGLLLYYILTLFLLKFNSKLIYIDKYYAFDFKQNLNKVKIIISLSAPVIIFFILRQMANQEFNVENNVFLLDRIGLSGNDINNGGILGSLQFLGGNRISQCLINLKGDLNSIPLATKIYIFNCSLSILSMILVSLISIFGLFIISKKENKLFNFVILPFLFLLISYTFILQQSSSVHLMGYSYFFSIIFSFGLSSIIFKILEKLKYSLPSILLTIPIMFGILILLMRVSMLTGLNG